MFFSPGLIKAHSITAEHVGTFLPLWHTSFLFANQSVAPAAIASSLYGFVKTLGGQHEVSRARTSRGASPVPYRWGTQWSAPVGLKAVHTAPCLQDLSFKMILLKPERANAAGQAEEHSCESSEASKSTVHNQLMIILTLRASIWNHHLFFFTVPARFSHAPVLKQLADRPRPLSEDVMYKWTAPGWQRLLFYSEARDLRSASEAQFTFALCVGGLQWAQHTGRCLREYTRVCTWRVWLFSVEAETIIQVCISTPGPARVLWGGFQPGGVLVQRRGTQSHLTPQCVTCKVCCDN